MSKPPIGYYRFPHGMQLTVTIPAGVTAWKGDQRENLTMTVRHPQRSAYVVFGDHEIIEVSWFNGAELVRLNIRVEWIVGRERILPSDPVEEQITVEFGRGVTGAQMSVYMWLRDIGRNPGEWQVYRGQELIKEWDSVNRGEQIILKPVG